MRVVVVGSGVSGCHAALTLLEHGHDVELWDVGGRDPEPAAPGVGFHELKAAVPDAWTHFLGADLEALVPPGAPELLRYPPARRFLARPTDALWDYAPGGMTPFASLATGGLATGWGANALAFDEDDLRGWPVSASEMAAAYRTVFARVGVAGPQDDALSPHLAPARPTQPPLPLSMADELLLQAYARRQHALARRGVLLGRARMAVVSEPGRPDACDGCDRCLWGCPRGAIHDPARATLQACRAHRGFTHRTGRFVVSLRAEGSRVTALRYLDVATDTLLEQPCEAVFLAAGALATGAIFLRTLQQARPDLGPHSESLMDTAVVKLPYLMPRAIGRAEKPRTFQFNRLILGLLHGLPSWPRYLHGEVLHLTGLLYHPLIERMPLDTRAALGLFFALKSALGAVSLFFPDRPAPGNRQTLVETGRRWASVRLDHAEPADRQPLVTHALRQVRAALWRLGCVPRAAVRSHAGAGIHYAGTVPMGPGPRRCGADGRSNLYANLFIADGAAFPTLPSKSLTMSLAAHATRVAALCAR